MLRKFLKVYLFAAILFSDFLMFADDNPGTGMEDENGNTDGSVEQAPINGWMIYMMLLGICFAFYYLKNRKTQVS
ncbi:hypothetical protein J2X31_002575 [Flavobacterium arsenatis]|uniref:Signal peptidase n=1 Tax=Flavobacterium arsenatis TaxID=1484332 RepID=A0ABU1TRQ5_9FLAO|nr:hypothetical protein [Flavobacterium arsenatis]